jgi:hypothetical protein
MTNRAPKNHLYASGTNRSGTKKTRAGIDHSKHAVVKFALRKRAGRGTLPFWPITYMLTPRLNRVAARAAP